MKLETPLRATFVGSLLIASLCAPMASANPLSRVVYLRADAANGSTHYPIPGFGGPWVNLAGGPDAIVENFHGTGASGWAGQGTHASPYRLYWEGPKQRAIIAAASVAALQDSTQPVTAEVWFKTGFNGPRPESSYLLDWLQPPSPSGETELTGKGMSICVQNGHLQVRSDDWTSVAVVAPDTWYHVAVVKAAGDLRVYVNGVRVLTESQPHMGAQNSPLTVGCSIHRYYEGFTGGSVYADYWDGAIAQVQVWTGAMTDGDVAASFGADSALYLPNPAPLPLVPLVRLRADSSAGATRYPIPGASGPWVDVTGEGHDATLHNFTGADTTSGWAGAGVDAAPYRLQYDGTDDVATIPAGSIPEMQELIPTTTEVWFRTGSDASSSAYRYLVEWLASLGSTYGLDVATRNGTIQVHETGTAWTPIATITPNTWYHVVVVKRPGLFQTYVNGSPAYATTRVAAGVQGTEIVIGGSTWRGTGVYGDVTDGAIGQFRLWQGAMDAAQVLASFRADSAAFFGPHIVHATAGPHGAVAPVGDVIVPHGGSQTFTITPAACYDVADVLVDGASIGPVTTTTLTGVRVDHTLAASFVLRSYSVVASAGAGGTISPSGNVAVGCGATQAFTMTPDACHDLADVLVDGVSVGSAPSYAFTDVQVGHTIAAVFTLKSFTITATAGAGGTLSPSGNVPAPCGSSSTFTLTPAPCHVIGDVVVDGVSMGPVPSYTFTDVAGGHTLAASFALVLPTITASAGPGGSIAPAGTTTVGCGEDLAVTVTPDVGRHVVDVVVDGVSVGAVTAHTFSHVVGDHTLSATFAVDEHALAVAAVGHGVVQGNPAGASYTYGTPVELTAYADPGWAFATWSGDASGSANPVTVIMTADRSVTATFTHVDLDPVAHLLTPNGSQTLVEGETCSILWNASDDHAVTSIDLAFSTDAGATWSPIATGIPNSGSYAWTVPSIPSWNGLVRVCAHDVVGQQAMDSSDTLFAIHVAPARALDLRAGAASGSGPYPSPGASGPWMDLAQGLAGALQGFAGTPESGWNGDGSLASPYRLEFSGSGECVILPPASVPQIQSPEAATAAVWFRTPTGAEPNRYYYLLEWAGGDGGMAIAMHEDRLQVFLDPWVTIAELDPGTWHQVIVAKQPNQVRVYLDGVPAYTGDQALFGGQQSRLAIGASTWRGTDPDSLRDFYRGAIGQVRVWRGGLSDAEAHADFQADAYRYGQAPLSVGFATTGLRLLGCNPNPARSALRVAFSLPDAAPARLELIDLAGRRVRGDDVGSLGGGTHTLDLAREGMPPAGVYWVRLTRAGRSLTSRVAVIQ